MVSVWALCVIVFVLSDLGFVLSLRDVELRTRSCCPEVALEIVSVTFSVSRDRFNNFHFEVSRGWTVDHSKRMSGSARCL